MTIANPNERMIAAAVANAEPIRAPLAAAPELTAPDEDAALARLAALSPIEYDRQRQGVAERLGCRVATLDAMVRAMRPPAGDGGQGTAVEFPVIEPWPEPIDGAELLDWLVSTLRRYLVLPSDAVEGIALWIMHAHCHDNCDTSPVLAITSPEKRCGKTRVLSVIGELIPRPLSTANTSAAAIFRSIEKWRPTLLIDEADTFLADNEDLRGVLNSGHSRATAYVLRTVGDAHEPRRFATWAPKAIAAIGKLAGTIEDRSIAIAMRRKLPADRVERWRSGHDPQMATLCRMMARWEADHADALRHADPGIPGALHDRAADNWRPLFAIADAAGDEWPDRARRVALTLSGADIVEDQSRGVMLLADIRATFEGRGCDRLSSSDLAAALGAIEERPWAEWRNGKPITAAGLARLLKQYGIEPRGIRIGTETPKGYDREWFADSWARYLPNDERPNLQHPASEAACFVVGHRSNFDFQTATLQQSFENNGLEAKKSATSPTPVALSKAEKPNNINAVADVALCDPPAPTKANVARYRL